MKKKKDTTTKKIIKPNLPLYRVAAAVTGDPVLQPAVFFGQYETRRGLELNMPRLRLAAAGCFLFCFKERLVASLNDRNYLNSKSASTKTSVSCST